jgi:glutamate/tyrosine decarboxylase-like PLP-dependent enzyme
LPSDGLGEVQTESLLRNDVCPALSGSSQTPNYYGFVTGGATNIAKTADGIVTQYDQNVQVHLPLETIATDVEDAALRMLCQLLNFDPDRFGHRILTTGATASNLLGLACARQYVLSSAARRNGTDNDHVRSFDDVARVGFVKAMRSADLDEIQILTTVPHSSLGKAASIVGMGRDSIKLVHKSSIPHKFDLQALEQKLKEPRTASIVVVSCSEVNTGLYATDGQEMSIIRDLCDTYGAWLHVDGAFGIMGRCLDSAAVLEQYDTIIAGCENMQLADSITGDAHKLLNVPYDCGFFLSSYRDIGSSVFQNAGAAYLQSGSEYNSIASPLNFGIENSRRFRALPVYANLLAFGRRGYHDMLERQINLARRIAEFIRDHGGFELLPANVDLSDIFMIVLFRARDAEFNAELVSRINSTGKIYVSGTKWEGKPACRFAISNWQVDVERDIALISEVLHSCWLSRV